MGWWNDLKNTAGQAYSQFKQGTGADWSNWSSPEQVWKNLNPIGGYAANKATGPGGPFASSDYQGAASKQAGADQAAWTQQTQANRPNQSTPFGSSSWTKDASGNWTQSTQLDPQLQAALDSLKGQWAQNAGQPLPDGEAARKAASDSIYSQETSRLDPQFQQREGAMRTQLMNQGLDPNSEAFKTEMDNFGRTRNDAYQGAMNHSITGGGEEAQRQVQMAMALRNAPLMEMLGMGQFGQMPNFTPAGQPQTPDYMGAYGMQQKADADKWGSIFKLLGAGASAFGG